MSTRIVGLLPSFPEPTVVEYAEGHFQSERTVEDVPGVGKMFIGKDLRLYRRTNGLMSLIAPADPVKDSKPGLWIDKVEWGDFPPLGQVKDLQERFFSKFDREVMVLIGKKWDDSGWFFMVPRQVGTACSIEWADKEGVQWFLRFGRYIGTIHVHPGGDATPSSVDRAWWAEREASGLHMVLGRTGRYTMSGSCAGYTVELLDGTLDEAPTVIPATLYTSMNRPVKELLLVPPPPQKTVWRGHTQGRQRFNFRKYNQERHGKDAGGRGNEYREVITRVGGMLVHPRDIEDMRVLILPDGTHTIVTAHQWMRIVMALRDRGMKCPKSIPLDRFTFEEGGTNGTATE
jgi:hypothetical protein